MPKSKLKFSRWTTKQKDLVMAKIGTHELQAAQIEAHGSIWSACTVLSEEVGRIGPARSPEAVLSLLGRLGVISEAHKFNQGKHPMPSERRWPPGQILALQNAWLNRHNAHLQPGGEEAFWGAVLARLATEGPPRTVNAAKQKAKSLDRKSAWALHLPPTQDDLQAPLQTWEHQLTTRAIAILAQGDRARALLAFAQAGEVLGVIPEVTMRAFAQAFPGLPPAGGAQA